MARKLEGGNSLTGILSQSSKRFTGNNNYKDKRFEWILLSVIKALEKDNAKQRVINHQFNANRESQNSLAVYKDTLIFCSRRQNC